MTTRTITYRQIIKTALLIALFIGMSIAFTLIPSDRLVDFVGSNNAFFLMFVLGMIGGFTTFTSIPYPIVLLSLAAGRVNPIGLGLATAFGVMIGDSTMYLIGRNVRRSLPPHWQTRVDRLTDFIERHPRWVTPTLICYGLFSPFSNDFIVASLSIAGYSYWRIIIPLTIGNIGYEIGLAYLGYFAYDRIIGWF